MDTNASAGGRGRHWEATEGWADGDAEDYRARSARFEEEVQERPEAEEAREFSAYVEETNAPFRELLTKKFLDTRQRLMARYRSKYEEEIEEFARSLATKERELKLARAEARIKELHAHRLEVKLENVLEFLRKKSIQVQNYRIANQYIQEWKSKAAFHSRSHRCADRASQACKAVRLKAPFHAWLSYARFIRTTYGKGEAGAKYETAICSTKERLQSSRDKLEQFTRCNEEIKEEDKREFMRGVCKLNLEALRIMKCQGASFES